MNEAPYIALVGNAPAEQHALLNAQLDEENLTDVCRFLLYGADGQPEEEALKDALDDYADGRLIGIVCLPTATSLNQMLAEYYGIPKADVTALNINPYGRLSSVLNDTPLADAVQELQTDLISRRIKDVMRALMRDLRVQNPRLAVLSLNEEVSKDADSEEQYIIVPAISECVKSGLMAFGPYNWRGFYEQPSKAFDAVLAMCDEQCLQEFKALSSQQPLTLFPNLDAPIVQTSAGSILRAAFLAIDVMRNRENYDAPYADPLQKLYHERKEDGDKSRFASKKRGFNPAEHRRTND